MVWLVLLFQVIGEYIVDTIRRTLKYLEEHEWLTFSILLTILVAYILIELWR